MAKKPATTVRWNREKKLLEKRCSKCHVWLPADADHFTRSKQTVDGLYHQCKPCKRDSAAKWRRENPDYQRQWKERNPERAKELRAAYRERNRPALREKNRQYAAANRDAIRARQQADYRRNADRRRQQARRWVAENADQVKDRKSRYYEEVVKHVSAEERRAAGDLYKADVQLGDGTLARIIGKRGDLWLVRLYDPIKVGKNQYQRVIQTRRVYLVGEVTP